MAVKARKARTTITPTSAELFAQTVRASGLPMDGLTRFLAAGYVPQPKQLLFHAAARQCDGVKGPTDIAFGGARGPGKSHAAFAQLAIDDCQRVPGLKGLFLRRVAKAARESIEDLRAKVLRNVRHTYLAHRGMIELANGSRVILGHFRSENDIDAFLGLEYDVIVIEEDTQLTASKKRDIETCLRTSKPGWRPRTYRTTNPGGIDHRGFKERFIAPFRKRAETDTRFVPATVHDNRFVNKEYRQKLEQLVGWKRRAWLEGDWDIEAGQYFSNWDHDATVIQPFEIPSHWPIWCGFDYGFTHPTAVYWLTENDGVMFAIGEHLESKKLPKYHAEIIHARTMDYGNRPVTRLDGIYAGADVWANKGDADAKTIADQYQEHGISMERATMDRISGWAEILQRLGERGKTDPTLKIFDRCARLIKCLPAVQHNPNRPEDVLKTNADPDTDEGGDDEADALRYGVMARRGIEQTPAASSSSVSYS